MTKLTPLGMPWMRSFAFSHPVSDPTTKLALAMVVRSDEGGALYEDEAGWVHGCYAGYGVVEDVVALVNRRERAWVANSGYGWGV